MTSPYPSAILKHMNERAQLLDLNREGMQALVRSWGEPTYRSDQILRCLYKDLKDDPQQMSTLPADLRTRLMEDAIIHPLRQIHETVSINGMTRKSLFALTDGQTIETVLMLYNRRRTLCISSQAGCGMGCPFCATGKGGLARNLSAGEIVAQVLHYARWLADPSSEKRGEARGVTFPTRLTNIVLMGMGEPLANYAATWQAIRLLTGPNTFGLGARHITLSTIGLAPDIDRMADEPLQIGLAVSLHAPTDDLRNDLVPINRRFPLAELLAACNRYSNKTHRRVTYEYALMAGINDSLIQARQLAHLLQRTLCNVNLIPLNPVSDSPYRPTSDEQAQVFSAELQRLGIETTVRLRRGIEINAGCGQLRQQLTPSLVPKP